jgi:serine/threonine-protein kinase
VEILAQLEKILAGADFLHSVRMSRFLRFAVERSLQGKAAELKEYLIGVEVFDRPESYDPRIDPIVRVEARRLRSKLKNYYDTEGRDDALRIEFPKGSYVPVFRTREQPKTEATPQPHFGEHTIAVLPFTNLSSDPENEYFSDGLTEELIHALTKIEGLRVVAWNTAFQFKDKGAGIREVGRQLGVETVLEGSVRRWGDRLRITAQMLQVTDGHYLWSQVYERQAQDIFAIQDEISRAIAGALRIKLNRPLVKPQTQSLEAYGLYLRGRFCGNKRTEEGLRKGIDYFNQAIAGDAHYAPAYSGLADSYALLGQYGLGPAREFMPKAKAAAMKALEIDDSLAEAHTSFAYVRSLYEWEWADAQRHYSRALELNPGYANLHHFYGMDYLGNLGRLDEGLEHVLLAQQLDPLSLMIHSSTAFMYMLLGDYERAIQERRKALELDPTFYKTYMGLGRVYLQMRKYDEAIANFKKGQELSAGALYTCGPLGEAYALAGRTQEARQLLGHMIEVAQNRYVAPTTIALIYIGLGEKDRAFDWLAKACDERDTPLVLLKVHPAYESLRSDRRYSSLLERLGLCT